jgi:hypothetical protein
LPYVVDISITITEFWRLNKMNIQIMMDMASIFLESNTCGNVWTFIIFLELHFSFLQKGLGFWTIHEPFNWMQNTVEYKRTIKKKS